MKNLLFTPILVLVAAFTGCSPFVTQCDGLSEKDEQIECLDTAFEELRLDADECHARQYDGGGEYYSCTEGEEFERAGAVFECQDGEWVWIDGEPVEERPDDSDWRDYCEGLEPGDEGWERCQGAHDELRGVHERTRGEVERGERAEERRRSIRRGLRDGRDIAACESGRGGYVEEGPCDSEYEVHREGSVYVCEDGEWVEQ